jgi:fructoselysine 6-phosphate deglycase
MKELDQYIERALHGDDSYFAVDRAPGAFEEDLLTMRGRCRELAAEFGAGVRNIYLVGAGGALANVVPLKAIFDRLLTIPSDEYQGYALVGQEPTQLGPDSLVFLASNTGETEDTLAALRFARSRGARTIAVGANETSTLAQEADASVGHAEWDDNIFLPPLLVALALSDRIADEVLAAELLAGLGAVPGALRQAVSVELPRAEERAREFLGTTHFFVLGSGVLSALAYKLAYNIVMENVRISAAFIDALEYRHGPCEALERSRPDMLFLLGTDWSREQTLRTLDACHHGGAHTLVYDAADYEGLHPLLAPLVLYMAVQPFVIHSAVARGIVDLYPRVFMGKRGSYSFERSGMEGAGSR